MSAFFHIEREYPPGAGFGLFSWGHFMCLALCALMLGALVRVYCRAGCACRARLRRVVGLGAVLLELLRAGLLWRCGLYDLGRLPLHLCTMAIYICAAHAFLGGALTGQFLYAFCMPGALFALFFPDWAAYPLVHFMTAAGFLLHALIVGYVLMQVASRELIPDVRALPRCCARMLAIAAPVYIFDRLTDTNYMFLSRPSPGSPLELFAFLGRPGYILGYIPLAVAAWAVLYAPFVRAPRNKKSAG